MCQAAILDEDGTLLDEIRFANTPEEIEEFSGKLTTFHDEVKAVVESTGNLWIQIHDRLEEHGFDVALSNPSKTRLIAEAKVKTDKVDARTLASLLRADMLPTCYVPGEELRSRRELLRHRLNLVKIRTGVKNRVHGLLDKHGLRMPGTTPFSRENIAWLRGQSFGFMDDAIVRSDLAVLEAVDAQVTLIEEKIAALAAEDRRVRLLMTMTGVGYFTAMLVMAVEVMSVGSAATRSSRRGWGWCRVSTSRGRGSGWVVCRVPVIRGFGGRWWSVLRLRSAMILGSETCMSVCRGVGVPGVRWWLWLMRWPGSCTSCW